MLAKSDHVVLLVVRKQAKIGELGANEKFVIADISEDRNDWFDHLDRPDVLLHLAWGGLPNYLDNYHVEIELPLQVKFLNNLIIGGLRRLVVTGTCYEYGISDGEQYGKGQLELLDTIKAKAKANGLWNFFLPNSETGQSRS